MLCGGRTHIQRRRVHMKGTTPDICDTEMKKALHFCIRGSNLCSNMLEQLSKSAWSKCCAVSAQVLGSLLISPGFAHYCLYWATKVVKFSSCNVCFELGEFQVLDNFFAGREGVVCNGSRFSGRGVCE